MIKICHLIPTLMTNHGPSNVIFSLINGIDKNIFKITVWSMREPPPDRDPRRQVLLSGATFRTFFMKSFIDIKFLFDLWKELRREKPDILHCHLVRANLYGRIAAKLAGIRLVISTVHNVEDYMIENTVSSRLIRVLESLTSFFVTKYLGVSEGAKLAAVKYLNISERKAVGILNGIDLGQFIYSAPARASIRSELGISEEGIVIGSIGGLIVRKNHLLLIRAAEVLARKFGHIYFIIVGEGDQKTVLESLIAASGLKDKVFLLGFRNDVSQILSSLDIFVLPSLAEGFGLVVCEAMAQGLPCIASDILGTNELIVDGRTGYLVPPNDLEGLNESIEKLVVDLNLRSKMGQLGRERAYEMFGSERMINGYTNLYLSLYNTL